MWAICSRNWRAFSGVSCLSISAKASLRSTRLPSLKMAPSSAIPSSVRMELFIASDAFDDFERVDFVRGLELSSLVDAVLLLLIPVFDPLFASVD